MAGTRSIRALWQKTIHDVYNIEKEVRRFERHVTQASLAKMSDRIKLALGDQTDTASMYTFGFDVSDVRLMDHKHSTALITKALKSSASYASATNAAIAKYTTNPYRAGGMSAHDLIDEWAYDLTLKAYIKATTYFDRIYVNDTDGKNMRNGSWGRDKTFKDLFPIIEAWNTTQKGKKRKPVKKFSKNASSVGPSKKSSSVGGTSASNTCPDTHTYTPGCSPNPVDSMDSRSPSV
ncbi:hypothetical protein T484DRAFT_1757409 [Baffinella frigidus]|nr:hypothetical protein T484DRAFT_1757409 [Cryptophyta sp. CCMP2293]